MDFSGFFEKATGSSPYPYQCSFSERLLTRSQALRIPTGCGKTLAVLTAWLWQRRFQSADDHRASIPRRLVYCLPMRVLVEQTCGVAKGVVEKLGLQGQVAVHTLMGGEVSRDWVLEPEQDAILIGTQDMLLSRALNRGYASARSRWPQEFGLLNNDCLWVMDEIQLMGNGLATTIQLDSFRNTLGKYGACPTIWMSATFEREWLRTVDHLQLPKSIELQELDDSDRSHEPVRRRLEAQKALSAIDIKVSANPQSLASKIIETHEKNFLADRKPSLTLVVLNTVKRAVDTYAALEAACRKARKRWPLIILHSRFRQPDREVLLDKLLRSQEILTGKDIEPESDFSRDVAEHGLIVVSTQVIEAGVDLSARTLFTDLCPWASLVQRLGRCNRGGEFNCADAIWLDMDIDKSSEPYSAEELRTTQAALKALPPDMIVSSSTLPKVPVRLEHKAVIRKKDIIELFDTTPDLSGSDVDVSRFIREADDLDVSVLWRDSEDEIRWSKAPRREELCPVPVKAFKDFSEQAANRRIRSIFRWDFLEGAWQQSSIAEIFPGQVFLLAESAGGYDANLGWTGKFGMKVMAVAADGLPREQDSIDRDPYASGTNWQTIAEHTDRVAEELIRILEKIGFAPREALLCAARWHDRGKAHPVFQAAIANDGHSPGDWAKAPSMQRYSRRRFRHELASALAVLKAPESLIPESLKPLVSFLVAAHHGKVRLSIRSLPGEQLPPNDLEYARGIWEGDRLPATHLGHGLDAPEILLSLHPMRLGTHGSWAGVSLQLRDDPNLGPMRLAFLEALLRAGDQRVSGQRSPQEVALA